ncbi:Tripartite motif-containing protein 45 [Stylophora pistillata]|uniref:Tripartite motif-containing protein 45 n=1 Tax=Stylophora pistillata TaxID=50429 RepID=A0A2B4R761_STYPI|nr:Tripartite motif-containing protein 45 [Stylophora pistillata]
MAKASTLAENLEKELECAVCLEQFKDPKVLPCLHSFCKICLEGLVGRKGKGNAGKLNCPTCRTTVEIPERKVDSLPVNFFLNNLLSMVSLHGDPESSKLECDNCESGDAPVNRCNTCCHFLCEFCTQAHRRGRGTSSHGVVSIEEAKKMGSVAVTKPSLCQEHDGELLKLFCETCDEAICRDCTIVKHREHQYTFVKDAFTKNKKGVVEILSRTKRQAGLLKKGIDGVLQMRRNVALNAEQAVQEVLNCFQKLSACLNARCEELIHDVEELKNMKEKTLEIQQEELEAALGSVQSSVEFTEKALENGSEVEILNMRKTYASMSTVTMGHWVEGLMYNTISGQPVEFIVTAKEWDGRKREEEPNEYQMSVKLNANYVKNNPCTWFSENWKLCSANNNSRNQHTSINLDNDSMRATMHRRIPVCEASSWGYQGGGYNFMGDMTFMQHEHYINEYLYHKDPIAPVPLTVYGTSQFQFVEFTVTAKQKNGMKCQKGGDQCEVKICAGKGKNKFSDVAQFSAKDVGNGTYNFNFTPNQVDMKYRLSVKLNGFLVKGSSCTWHSESWQLCQDKNILWGSTYPLIQIDKDSRVQATSVAFEKYCREVYFDDEEDIQNKDWGRGAAWNERLAGGLYLGRDMPEDYGDYDEYGGYEEHEEYRAPKKNVMERLTVIGTSSFQVGNHSWKAKMSGEVSDGFSFGVVVRNNAFPLKWMWEAGNKYQGSSCQKSTLTNCINDDMIEFY